jgi:hypothetical protein
VIWVGLGGGLGSVLRWWVERVVGERYQGDRRRLRNRQDWREPPLYPEFRKSHAPRPPVALFADRSRARVASSIQSFDNSVVKVNEFGLTQSVDIDLCHLVTANVMEQWGSMD